MKKTLLILFSFLFIHISFSQDISVRVRQTSFSAADPDMAGPATGTVTFKFELRTSAGTVLADGLGLSVVYQSSRLAPTPTNTTLKLGPINTALWTQQVDNRLGNSITPVTYGGRSFDMRMIITFNQNSGVPDALITTAWTEVAQITYYTLGPSNPQGGYIVPEPGTIVAQNELSSDGGLSTYPYLSPELSTPLALGSGTLPVRFTKFDAECLPNNTSLISWTTAEEINSSHFEVEKSANGIDWKQIGRVNANGNSSVPKNYEFNDQQGGTAQYRLKQVDKDGKTTYSSIARTTCETKNVYVKLYPVPARDFVNLVIGSDRQAKTTIQVFDNKGKLVMNMPVVLSNGQNNFRLNVQNFAAGEYYIRGTDPAVEISKRFTVVR